MNADHGTDLAARREQLRLRSAQLREQIAVDTRVLRPGFRAVDRVRGGVRSVRDNRALVLLAGAALAGATLARPRAMVNLGLRAWSGWQVFRRVRPLVGGLLRQL
ncbi:MAG: YqjK family protein [Ottowia sp.]|uniref:YqjK family protein n=1 Tax=Ottowia sp. TaxID=1898956 RepID=UPI0039E5ACA5